MQQALGGYRHPLASEHRIDLRGRVGLNTGPVIVDRMKIVRRGGEHLASDPMADLAASLLDRTAPGPNPRRRGDCDGRGLRLHAAARRGRHLGA